jgi:hypothetical protein
LPRPNTNPLFKIPPRQFFFTPPKLNKNFNFPHP